MNNILWQRCFQIPKKQLNLFLLKLEFESTQQFYAQADYVFDNNSFYDVVVSGRGKDNTYQTNYHKDEIEKFAKELWDNTNENS